MKLLSIFFVCAFVAIAKCDFLDQLKQYGMECKEEFSATDEEVAQMAVTDTPTSRRVNCLKACFMKKANILTEDGKINQEGAAEYIKNASNGDEEKIKTVSATLDNCRTIDVPDDICDAAVEYIKCSDKSLKEIGIKLH